MSKWAGRAMVALAVMTTLAVAAPSAGADPSHPVMTMPQYRVALHAYQVATDAIDLTLHRQIDAAKADELAAMAAATSPADVYLARADFNQARTTDIADWQAALAKLGPPPRSPLLPPLNTTTTTSPSLPSGD